MLPDSQFGTTLLPWCGYGVRSIVLGANLRAPLASFKRHEVRLARYQRRMARKVRGSRNWHKAKARVQRLHGRIANVRQDFLHKASSQIAAQHAMAVIEDLRVRNMSASASGSAEQPGRNVRAKSSLNKGF